MVLILYFLSVVLNSLFLLEMNAEDLYDEARSGDDSDYANNSNYGGSEGKVKPGGKPGGNPGVKPRGNPGGKPGGNAGVKPGVNTGVKPGGNPGGNAGGNPGGNNGAGGGH